VSEGRNRLDGCHGVTEPGTASLKLKDKPGSRADSLVWQWKKGDATMPSELGDPTAADDYTLCMYDEAVTPTLVFSSITRPIPDCSHNACWVNTGTGFTFHGTGELCGIKKFTVSAGDARDSRIVMKAKGDGLPPLPSLPLALPLRVQLVASTGACWEAEYTSAGATKNDAMQFSGRSE